ncbi:MAG: GDSL-type esterase/lipase family protein [Clostridia bacterium]|nr:GDSL-type esterase/lipase family protein [Clostridia bacterium]
MDSSHRDRIKEIQRRKEEREKEAKKKRILFNRCLVILIGLAIIFLIVFGIKSCVSSVLQKRAEKAADEQAITESVQTPQPQQNDIINTEGSIDQSFYAGSAFVGNSFIDGMEIYELLDDVDYFARVGLSVNDAMSLSTSTGSVPVIDELNKDTQYKKIFFMFGENELGWQNISSFQTNYEALIEKARAYQPSAEIYLLAITPITDKVSSTAKDGTTNENIVKFNKLIREVAQAENVNFADIYSAVVNDKGCLPDEAASDGIHFGEEYYKKCLIYIQNAFRD